MNNIVQSVIFHTTAARGANSMKFNKSARQLRKQLLLLQYYIIIFVRWRKFLRILRVSMRGKKISQSKKKN